jgi:hypothetical protein
MNENEFNWVNESIYTYNQPNTGIFLNISVSCGISSTKEWGNNYHAGKLVFCLKDESVNDLKSKIDLKFADICNFVDQFETVNKNGNTKEIFQTQFKINIIKHYYNEKKELYFIFKMIDDKPFIDINIKSKNQSPVNIRLPIKEFKVVLHLIKHFKENYLTVTNNILQITCHEQVLNVLNSIKDDIDIIKSTKFVNKVETKIIEHVDEKQIKEDLDFDFDDSTSNFQKMFENEINIDEQELDINNDDLKEKLNESKILVPYPLFGSFLNFDILNLENWSSAFINTTEGTKSSSFVPLNVVANSALEQDEIKFLENQKSIYKAQYVLNILFRENILRNIQGKKINKPLIYKFNDDINPDSNIGTLSKEILIAYGIYSEILTNYISKLDETEQIKEFSEDLIISRIYLQHILFSFVVSLKVEDWELFKSDLYDIVDAILESKSLNNLKERYNMVTMGGVLKFDIKSLEVTINKLVDVIKNNKISTFNYENIDDICLEKGIPLDRTFDNKEDVKDYVLEYYKNDKEEKEDKRLKVFFNCIKPQLKDEKINKIFSNVKNYEELTNIFQTKNVPSDIMKIKRVMDIDKELKKRSEILDAAKKLAEDETVTLSSNFSDEEENPDDEVDDDILEELFGDSI